MITFSINENLLGTVPEPKRSGKYLPSYYKNLPVQINNSPDSGTAKQCVPFMEAITAGYVIPLWTDVYIIAQNGEVEINFPENYSVNDGAGRHAYQQLEGYPESNTSYGKELLKFFNPWIVETPPGVSCIFTSPMNHFDTRFKLISGIVDTDNYYGEVNLPFTWGGGDGEFFIEKGTPLVQVIPFVRYNFNKHKVTAIDHKKRNKRISALTTVFHHGYRNYYWHKRKK